MSNQDLRAIARAKNVRLWEVADRLNISEPTMTRKMRRELPADEKARIISIIDDLATAKQKN